MEDWLLDLGLDDYWENFKQSGYTEPRMLEDLKVMNKETLRSDFNITKPGHLDKLFKAIQKVQYPTEGKFEVTKFFELMQSGANARRGLLTPATRQGLCGLL